MLVAKAVMNWHPSQLPPEALAFLSERHLATLSIPRQGRSPHVTPVGFTWDDDSSMARVITFADAQKVKLIENLMKAAAEVSEAAGVAKKAGLAEATEAAGAAQVSLCQVDGGRWLALEGEAQVHSERNRCAEGVRRYAERYRPPKERGEDRRVIEISVLRVIGRV